MNQFVDYLVNEFGYNAAVIIKNAIIGIALLLVGCLRTAWYISKVVLKIEFDEEHDLLSHDITMIILKKDGKKKIIMPVGLTPAQLFLNFFIIYLNHRRILKRGKITGKERDKARRILTFVTIFTTTLVVVSFYLIFTVMNDYM
ncbi:hypothetical protein [Priestia aryabhattai]|uniref:hypothetical protein n=1 Tax=Priestia aryabhattai TaxID=412384 RepID=UPI002E20CC1B|nr:hypothetical protein [Priestia aryabhattai]